MRKVYFNDKDTGILKEQKPTTPPKNPMQGKSKLQLYTDKKFFLLSWFHGQNSFNFCSRFTIETLVFPLRLTPCFYGRPNS